MTPPDEPTVADAFASMRREKQPEPAPRQLDRILEDFEDQAPRQLDRILEELETADDDQED